VSTLSNFYKEEIKEAYSKSLGDMWILYACAAATGLLVSFAIYLNESETDGDAFDT
jgi:hypothetical protein